MSLSQRKVQSESTILSKNHTQRLKKKKTLKNGKNLNQPNAQTHVVLLTVDLLLTKNPESTLLLFILKF